MLKTKLYWRVLANFAFLLLILTAMTLLTLYLLAEIEKNFSFASSEIRVLTNVENVRHVLADAPEQVNHYLLTGEESPRLGYLTTIKEFDDAMTAAEHSITYTIMSPLFGEIKSLTYKWIRIL